MRWELSSSGAVVVIDSINGTEYILARKRPQDLKPFIEKNTKFPTFTVTGYENPYDPTDIREKVYSGFFRLTRDNKHNRDVASGGIVIDIKYSPRLEDFFSPDELSSY